ncbi:S8 family serine peptidase [Tessaracoccus sp. MC1865]|uniref:S8 family serine peptidase n=1 Tax=Tessaracoccus sp. MC1865 TaxID=2760310 RepID=UPI001600AABD|nr:S8 family serine peptidase [Tessaracoccus sp. MC1865]MBB1482666.1 S8 family serine peptidase [Tessaracoccus sp. MC1865]QTO37884.1 S8 family serine peptidase [Tessaracoccus sp. MC1865]
MFQQRWWRTAMTSLVVAALTLSPAVSRADDQTAATVDLGNLADHVTTPSAELGKTWPTGEWFVEFRSQPTVSGGRQTQLQRDRSDFTAEARAASLPAEVNRVYTRLFNGVTVRADDAQARKLAGLRSVRSVQPVLGLRVPTAPPSADGSPTRPALAMIGADRAQSALGVTGRGVKVGIIDSGVDYTHPDLGGTGSGTTFPTARVAYGRDLIGDHWSPSPDDEGGAGEIAPDRDPMDCLGHGTHVAGTVGGAGEVVGVAPEATLGAYKVLTCSGDTTMAVVLDAMERATADGMDVVNMSLGWPFQSSPNHPLSQAGDRMVDAGVVLVVAAGNEGEMGTQTLRAPSVAEKAIAVASFDSTSIATPEVVFTPASGDPIRSGYTVVSAAPVPTGFTGELARFSDPLQCKLDPALEGRIALLPGTGGCDIERRTQLALDSGAIGVVLHGDYFSWEWAEANDIPMIGILADAGRQVVQSLANGPVTVTVPGTFIDDPNPYTPGLASSFTSWGLDAELGLKPDLAAPGGDVYSTLPLSMGGHGLSSGTSMAAPHVAGAAALLLQRNPGYTPVEIRTRLQNTATPAVYSFMPQSGVLDAAHRQGAGLIHVDRAITQQHLVTPSKLATGQSADGPFRQTLTLTNATDAPVTWRASHDDAVTSSVAWGESRTQNRPDFTQEAAEVAFSAPTVTVPAGGSATVDVTIDAPETAPDTAIYSGFLQFTTDGDSLRVPFAGMKGDYGDAPLLFPQASASAPFLGVLWGCAEVEGRQCTDSMPAFGVREDDTPYDEWQLPAVGFTLGTPASAVTLSVLATDTQGTPVERSEQEVYTEPAPWRSPEANFAAWDGMLAGADGEPMPAPHGTYALRITVTNSDTPALTETWTSPSFTWLEAIEPEEPSPEPTRRPTTAAPRPEVRDVYNTPGLHMVNGRQWFTACEPYSQTVRCRTMIMATTVTETAGAFTQTTGWVFNNLTYLPRMTRAQWGTNPLARGGAWTSADGRTWRTECDTAATGRGGCRTYLGASVIAALPTAGGGTQYTWVTKEILNNIVRFR